MAAEQVVIKFISDTDALKANLEQELNQIGSDAEKQFKKANTEAVKYTSTLDKAEKEVLSMAKAQGDSAAQGELLLKEYKALVTTIATGAINEAAQDFMVLGNEVVETTEKTKSMKAQLRELKEQIANATDPADIQRLSAAAGVLQDDIGDLNAKIKGLASDTRVFDGLLDAASGLAGGFAVLQGTSALFGTESKEIEKTLLKVNAAMSILQGLQQIQNVLQEESAASLLLGNAQRRIEVALTSESAVARTAATVAQYALNAATNLFPLVAIVSGLILAVKALNSYTSAAKDTGEAQRKLNKELEIQLQYIGAASKQYETAGDVRKIQLEGELALLKSVGASEDEIKSKEIQIAEQRLKAAAINKTLYKDLINNIQNEGKLNKQLEIRRKLEQELADISRTPEDDQTKAQKRRATDIQNSLKLIQELVDKGTSILKEFNDAQNELIELQLNAQKEGADKSLEIELARIGAAIALREAEGKSTYALQLKYLSRELSALEAGTAAYITKLGQVEALKAAERRRLSDAAAAQQRRIDEFNEQSRVTLNEDTAKAIKAVEDGITENAIANSKLRNKAVMDEVDKNLKEYEREKKEREAAAIALQVGLVDIASQTFTAIFDIDAQNRQDKLNADLAELDKRRQQELATKDLTESQKANITAKYAKQEQEIKKKAFEANKKAQIAEAIINGALAITKIFAQLPPGTPLGILGAVAVGLTAASTAIQIASIASQKYPAYAKGTASAKGGLSLVGERGPELMYVPKGAGIEPAHTTSGILNNYTIPQLNSLLSGTPLPNFSMNDVMPQRSGDSQSIDYGLMGKVVADAMAKNPSTRVTLDEKGFSTALINKSQTINIKNNRYSSR